MKVERREATRPALAVLLILAGLVCSPRELLAWGGTGHRAVAQVAEDHLSPEAKEAVRELIGSRSLAQVATWPDFIRSEKPWDFAKPWHFLTVDDNQTFEEVLARAGKNPDPDNVVEAIHYFAGILGGDPAPREHFSKLLSGKGVEAFDGSLEATALIFLVHFVGDVHQPLHVGRGNDRGGNSISVNWFGELSNLHSVWDGGLIESEGLSFTELVRFLEAEHGDEFGENGGEIEDWARESIAYRFEVYEIWSKTDRGNHLPDLSYGYAHDHIDVVKERLYLGGRRLADLLDSIYGPPKKAKKDQQGYPNISAIRNSGMPIISR